MGNILSKKNEFHVIIMVIIHYNSMKNLRTYCLLKNLYNVSKYFIYIHSVFLLHFQRNGADFSVFVNTAQEFDGSDSGARPDEAVSWGKIKMDAKPVKVIHI